MTINKEKEITKYNKIWENNKWQINLLLKQPKEKESAKDKLKENDTNCFKTPDVENNKYNIKKDCKNKKNNNKKNKE